MSTYRKNITNKTKPISKYRYPHKFGLKSNFTDDALVRSTIEWKGITYDLLYYEGEKNSAVWCEFRDWIYKRIEDESLIYEVCQNIVDEDDGGLFLPNHFTLTFNNCELWGNKDVIPYVEVFPTSQWNDKRSERFSTFYSYDEELRDYFYIGSSEIEDREPKSHTPSMFVCENTERCEISEDLKTIMKGIRERTFGRNRRIMETVPN